MTQSESQIRSQIYEALKIAIRPYKGFIFPIETGGRDRPNRRIQPAQKGSPDLMMTYREWSVMWEVKTPEGTQSDNQKEFEVNQKAAGGFYFIVRSVEDALAVWRELDQLREGK